MNDRIEIDPGRLYVVLKDNCNGQTLVFYEYTDSKEVTYVASVPSQNALAFAEAFKRTWYRDHY